ncbi:MAG: O-antigen ligase family protein, partial [Chloroflexia bacterium]
VADRMTWWLVAYGVVLALGLLYADAPNLVMVELVEFVRNFLTYLLIINALTSLARVRGALWLLLAMGTLLAALTVFQTVTGNFDMDFGGLAQSHVSGITEFSESARPGGTVGDPNYYGQALLIVLPLALYLVSRGGRRLVRAAGLVAALLLVAAIVFTYSRGDALALAAVVGLALVYKRPPVQFILGGVVALGIVLSLLPSNYYARLGVLFTVLGGDDQAIIAESSLRGRAGAASAAIGMFADHPILGVGRGNYPPHELEYIAGTNLAWKSQGIPPHNLYLEIAAEEGAAGLFVVGAILLAMLRALADARRRFLKIDEPAQAELTIWLGIGLVGYLVSSIFLHGAFLYMLWLQVALIVALYHAALATQPAKAPDGSAYPALRAIRVREEQPMSTALLVPFLARPGPATPLPSERTSTDRGLLGLIIGIVVVLAAVGLLGLASNYAQREGQGSSGLNAAPGAVAGAGRVSAPVDLPQPADLQVSEPFLSFWRNNGGAPVFGNPVSPVMLEVEEGGRVLSVQYFERARFEFHPEFDDPTKQVQLGLLGSEAPVTGQVAFPLPAGLQGTEVVLGDKVPGTPPLFAAFWRRVGVAVLGYPIGPVMADTGPKGETLYVQYFQRGRLEYHPENAAEQQVQMSNLGTEAYHRTHGK